jgi:bifunctional non-homologous end joining protein LigD
MPGLAEYRRKRNFTRTPEPAGRAARARGSSFVVQKHAATRLHYDFRLELDGVLLSWAVPKGPSLDPSDKRLAMQTEDHPVEYGGFEGVIPKGEYGGGTVLLWDKGTWEPIGDPREGLRKGRLEFRLHGDKLRGRWMLVRIRSRDARDGVRAWLLIKRHDDEARAEGDVATEHPESVATGRAMDEIARAKDRTWHSNRPVGEQEPAPARRRTARPRNLAEVAGARRAALPADVEPQLATLVKAAPGGDDWLHEMKFDGYRILARVEKGRARLWSRNGKDWTARFPTVVRAVEALAVPTAILDGEVAMVLPDGTTSFNALQNAHGGRPAGELAYFVFDLPYLDGWDLRGAALAERKRVLEGLLAGAARPLRYSEHVEGGGEAFFREACRLKLEGIVSKRRDAPYAPGRVRTWLKTKCHREQELVIGGWTDPEGKRSGIGALLVGVYDTGKLLYAGKVGTGFSTRTADELRRALDRLALASSPFSNKVPRMARAHWVKPALVANVAFTEWTPDGRLRHPSFQGLREDKPAREVVREKPVAPANPSARDEPTEQRARDTSARPPARGKPESSARGNSSRARGDVMPAPAGKRRAAAVAPAKGDGAIDVVEGVRITHADRVLYPEQGITKRALAEFYVSIAARILPHLVDRPTTLVRCPDGLGGGCFYQKHAGHWAPPSLRRVEIPEKHKVGEYLIVDDLPGLVGLVQIGILEIHTWNARVAHLEQPDQLVFDLDPAEDVPWPAVVAAARLLRTRLEDHGLRSFLKTTGGKGFHLVVPIARGPGWDECGAFSHEVAERLVRDAPEAFVAVMSKAKRAGRIFIDYLRNQRGSTSVAAYSTRAKAGAPVSTPITWDELDDDVRPTRWTVANLPQRLASLKRDPWDGFATIRQRLPGASRRTPSARRASTS